MKKLCADGYKISSVDTHALDKYLLVTPSEWARSALDGMINKSLKIIVKDYYDLYKSKQTTTVSTEMAVVIPGILEMPEFKKYNVKTPPLPIVQRTEAPTTEVWSGGFDVQDYENDALIAYYEDPEAILKYFMENKIYQRRKAFMKKYIDIKMKDVSTTEMPKEEDAFINQIVAEPEYKTRAEEEV
jgi:hypothetical protein